MADIVPIKPAWKPRTFTSAEAMLDEVRAIIHADQRSVKEIAHDVGVSTTTIYNIRIGHTRWPRQTTLFPLLKAMGKRISIVDER
jgi:DNA-binding phage protein